MISKEYHGAPPPIFAVNTTMSSYEILIKAADTVAERLGRAPLGLVLGSGLSEALDSIENPRFMDYQEIPGMPKPTTEGHRGALLHGRIGDVPILALCGRIHVYENYPLPEIAMPVRLLSMLGIHTLLVTSAVGSTDPDLLPGQIMLVEDHLNLSGINVLAGEHETRLGPRFPDVSQAYDPEVLTILEDVAALTEQQVSRGILAHFRGPSYETPAEVAMARSLGARVVSMSMVPEVLVAHQRGIRVGGIASVTNLAAGLADQKLDHEDVLRNSITNAETLQALLAGAVPRLAHIS